MKNNNQLYYRIFEKIMLIDTDDGNKSIFSKIVMKLMLFYKSICRLINSGKVRKRKQGKDDKKYLRLRQFKDIHKGKRCFIICTGPSLTLADVSKLKNEYTFSMNSIIKLFDKTDWRPTYYGISDAFVYNTLKSSSSFKSIKNKFVSSDIAKKEKLNNNDIVYYVDGYDLFKNGRAVHFSDDAYCKVYGGNTVTYDVMQIAAYMGFKKIYLLGCDSDYSGKKKHFDEYLDNSSTLDGNNFRVDKNIESYKTAKKYCDEHGIKIYNATRGGKLEVFPRVNFDSLFDDAK